MGGYRCSTCTVQSHPFKVALVTPTPAWSNHTHRFVLWGFDGEEFYLCESCDIVAYDVYDESFKIPEETQKQIYETIKARIKERDEKTAEAGKESSKSVP
jgi:hypothetical protein